MEISIIGTGYVGLVTGVCLAEYGHDVVLMDLDSEKIERINRGEPTIHEIGLEELLQKHIGKRLTATTDAQQAILATDLTFIVVGTPFNGQHIDLTYIRSASEMVGKALYLKRKYHVVVVKSTVVPGTTDKFMLPILEKYSRKFAGEDFGLGMNPEFLTEGEAIYDTMHPDRIVLGGIDSRTQRALQSIYSNFDGVEVLLTNNSTAEMIKYASNALLATLISYSNEIANLGTAIGDIDIVDVMRGVHASRYLTGTLPNGERTPSSINSFLMAGCGFGGSCLPKDVNALISHGKELGIPMDLLQSVLTVNGSQPCQIFALLAKHFPSLNGVRIAVLGLSFRPGTDDMRESPAIPIIQRLLSEGAHVAAYDPVVGDKAIGLFSGKVEILPTLESAMKNVEAVILITGWEEFERVPSLLTEMQEPPLFVDGRRMINKNLLLRYEGIGL